MLIPSGPTVIGPTGNSGLMYRNQVNRVLCGQVEIKEAFYLQTTELTVRQYQALKDETIRGLQPEYAGNPDHPVRGVSAYDVDSWIAALRKREAAPALPVAIGVRVGACLRRVELHTLALGGRNLAGEVPSSTSPTARLRRRGPSRWARGSPTPSDFTTCSATWLSSLAARLAHPENHLVRRTTKIHPKIRELFRNRGVRGGYFGSGPEAANRWYRNFAGPHDKSPALGFRVAVSLKKQPVAPTPSVRVQLRCVRAEDGKPLAASVHLLPPGEDPRFLTEGSLELQPKWRELVSFKISGAPQERRVWTPRDQPEDVQMWVELIPGLQRVERTVPLCRPIRIKGASSSTGGAVANDARVWIDSIGGKLLAYPWIEMPRHATPPDSEGRFEIDRIPWVPGAPVRITAEWGSGQRGSLQATLPNKWTRTLQLADSIREAEGAPESRGPRGPTIGYGGGGPVPFEKIDPAAYGRVYVRCTEDGKGVLDAVVVRNLEFDSFGRTSAVGDIAVPGPHGSALFPHVPPGRHRFEIFRYGHPVQSREEVVEDRKTYSIDLEAARYSKINVVLTRHEGGPAAWAEADLESPRHRTWHNLAADGTQHARALLNHEGKGTLHGVSPGPYTLRVSWFGRRIERAIEVPEGKDLTLALVLPAAPGWETGLPRKK